MKRAFYFGCIPGGGHVLHDAASPRNNMTPWSIGLMDTGLLKNGRIPDKPDGRVFWTCGGQHELWFAFYWWDRSGDGRANSNSGFYVSGFPLEEKEAAFLFACEAFPKVIERQHFPLVLTERAEFLPA